MTDRARRRRDLLDELEQLRALRLRVAPQRTRRAGQLRVQRLTRLSI
jgi:hypothetical protein